MSARTLRRAVAGALVALAPLLGATACDPCSGVVSCRGEPRLSVSGQVVDRVTGRPVPGVRIEVAPSAGSRAFTPLVATTDADGMWHAEGPADEGAVDVDVTVAPPAPRRAYRVQRVRARSSTRRGEGAVVGRWVADPSVQFLGEVQSRLTGRLVPNATVSFRRVGGVGATPAQIDTKTDASGRFYLQLAPEDVGDVVGEIVVAAPGLSPGTRFANARLTVQYRDEPINVGGVFPIGIWLTYTGEIYFRGTGELLRNTDIEFRRTGGVAVTPPVLLTRSDASGHFLLAPQPAAAGEVIGQLAFVPPGGQSRVTIDGIRLTTYDSLETRLLRVGYGEHLLYAGELQLRGTFARAVGVPVEFLRTGGIAISPSVLRATSDANGRFPIAAATTESGEVVGDLVIDPDGPRRHTFTGVRLRTFAADESRLAQVWLVGDGIFYSGELFRRGTSQRVEGAEVQFVRTGGVEVTPPTFTSRSDANGRFLIATSAAAPGTVTGDLIVRGPGSFTTRIRDVRLATQRDDSLRLAGVWGVGPSLVYSGEILNAAGDVPVRGASITFERTGGLAATPARVVATTDAGGRFPLHLTASDAGEVIGTLTIVPPAPWAQRPIVIPDVRLPTFDGDEQRLLAVWRIPPPP